MLAECKLMLGLPLGRAQVARSFAATAQRARYWRSVGLRAVHAAVYILVNSIPYRFAVWVSSFITLMVIWYRFAVAAAFS